MNDSIDIRRAAAPSEYRALQVAQRKAWGIVDDEYIVPLATMVGAQLHGGLVLGAFLPDGSAVGLSFAFLGRIEGRVGLYSQLTGVVPGFQDKGIGSRLKKLQREIARVEGCELIAWSFDPLQAGNARFNLGKLGASSSRYVEDMYGPRNDALNRNTPTDRLIAVWPTDPETRPWSTSSLDLEPMRIIQVRVDSNGESIPFDLLSCADAESIAIEIPRNINEMRSVDPIRASAWQSHVRTAFRTAFASGFRAVGFSDCVEDGIERSFYLLVRGG
ncbi:MAG: hypothetical protein SFX72_02585 [Isosphaeraceae bacterium]|nr:hypothetical protein [Isosphaeraceae bacterium]